MTEIFSKSRRAVAVIAAICAAALVYGLAPPPQGANAFESQSTWGGVGGGTANAQTISIGNVQSNDDVIGVELRYIPAADNTGPATISVNGHTALTVVRPTSIGLKALSGGELQAGVTMTVMNNGSSYEIRGPIDMTPIGKTVEFRGSGAPRGTLIEDGSCVSQATYAALFTVIGTTYGNSCSAGLFKLPFSNGTAFVAFDAQGANGAANRITTASCSNPNAPAECGSETHVLSIGEMPAHNHGGNTGVPTIDLGQVLVNDNTAGAGLASGNTRIMTSGGNGHDATQNLSLFQIGRVPAVTASSIASQGGGSAHPILNPVLPGIRAIKY